MKFQIESGVQLIKKPYGTNKRRAKKPVFPLGDMKAGDSIVIESNYSAVGKTYHKKYQNLYGKINYIKKKFGVEGSFRIGVDEARNLRILKIN